MKFVEKKCPNCGAGLKFDDGATSVVCEYCNQTFYIQRDEKKYGRVDEAHMADAYRFVDEMGKPIAEAIFKTHKIMAIVPIVVLAFVGIGFTIFGGVRNQMNNNRPGQNNNGGSYFEKFEESEEDKTKYVTKLSDIDSVTLETFYDTAKSKLHHMDNMDYNVGEWSPVGSYLLVSKDGKDNKLYAVMQHTYSTRSGKKKVTLYAAYLYTNLKFNDNNMIDHKFNGTSVTQDIDLDGKTHNFATGYESVEKLYNRVIRPQVGQYTIEATDGLYLES
jgi:hypothetical protein